MFTAIGAFFSKWFSRLRAFAMLAGAWGVLFSVITLIGFKVGFEYDDGLVFSTPAFKTARQADVNPPEVPSQRPQPRTAPGRMTPPPASEPEGPAKVGQAGGGVTTPESTGTPEAEARGRPVSLAHRTATKFEPAGADYWNAVNRAYKLEHIKPIPWMTAWFFKVFGSKVEIFCARGEEGSDSLQNSWRMLADNFYFIADENKKYELLERGRFIFYFTPSDEGVIQAKKADVTPIRIRKNKKSLNDCLYNPGKFGERMLPLSEF